MKRPRVSRDVLAVVDELAQLVIPAASYTRPASKASTRNEGCYLLNRSFVFNSR
jgi:hypothetical protein